MLMPGRQFYSDTATYNVGNTTTNSSSFDSTVILLYKHSFSDTPNVHPYITLPNVLNNNLTGSSFTNSRGVWTNYSSNSNLGKAIAMDNSTADTATVTLTMQVANGKKLGVKSFSFYHRVSASGYKYWKMYINGIEAGDSTLYMPTTGGTGNNTMQATGTRGVRNPAENLTGTVTVLLKLYGHDAAYPNGNAQGTFRMDEFTLNGYINDDGSSSASGVQYANKGGYRYGFNGQEKSDEIKGEGNSYTAEFWEYDPRLGRRWNLDPKPTVSFSRYLAFANNPIINIDIKGDSIEPNRRTPVNIIIVPITRDNATSLDYARLSNTKNAKYKTVVIQTNTLNKKLAEKIKKELGTDGFVNNMVIDFHRSNYDDMNEEDKNKFYTTLANGVTGSKTNVLLGMCWSGGAEINSKDSRPDLTLSISQKLDKATVYGLKTEANSVSFYLSGNFGVLNPAYYLGNGDWSRHERAFKSEWTITRFDNSKKYIQENFYKTVKFTMQGDITVHPIAPPTSTNFPFR
ncbi:MAG: hypothetical protein ABIT96_04220 [Ferruginibacter sp.]